MSGDKPNPETGKELTERLGSIAVVLGPGAKNNSFIGTKMNGYDNAVVTVSDGENGPEGNRFIDATFNRQSRTNSASSGVQQKISSSPWYKKTAISIVSTLASGLLLAWLVWLLGWS